MDDTDDLYTDISDRDFEQVMLDVMTSNPNIGQRRMEEALRGRGLRIRQRRLRAMMRALDPEGTSLRWYGAIYGKTYSVPSSNALWHIDSNRKLIRWRFVIHACIDGFSRLVRGGARWGLGGAIAPSSGNSSPPPHRGNSSHCRGCIV